MLEVPRYCIDAPNNRKGKKKERQQNVSPQKGKGQFRTCGKQLNQFICEGEPLLPIEITNTVPCMLHVTMAIIRLLLKLLVADTDTSKEFQDAMEEKLIGMGLTLVDQDPENQKTLSERIKASRFQRPEYLKILDCQNDLLEVFALFCVDSERVEKVTKSKSVTIDKYHLETVSNLSCLGSK